MSGIVWNHGSGGSGGGTELAARQLDRRMPADLLDRFQIYPSQYIAELADPSKIQLLWCKFSHEAGEVGLLARGGWRRFTKIIFASKWQAGQIIARAGIPWPRCMVIPNAVELVPAGDGKFGPVPDGTPVRLVYTSTPNRGLAILATVFNEICKRRDDVELDVFSSFGLYGEAWAPLDGHYEQVFDMLRSNPRVRYHGPAPHDQVLAAMSRAHVFAYPSTFLETSCMSLMEAMTGGLACVHPDYGALSETAAGQTLMYDHVEDQAEHARRFYGELMKVISKLRNGDPALMSSLAAQKAFADDHYGWDRRAQQWESVLRCLAGTAVPGPDRQPGRGAASGGRHP
jgi:UDP-glucose:(glucosyl)LPS alpha-1,2-glucosyltransferase